MECDYKKSDDQDEIDYEELWNEAFKKCGYVENELQDSDLIVKLILNHFDDLKITVNRLKEENLFLKLKNNLLIDLLDIETLRQDLDDHRHDCDCGFRNNPRKR